MKFSIKDTNVLKGLGILFMYVHHFYLSPDRYSEFDLSFYPLTQHKMTTIAVFLKICVSLFVFLSGYGMYISYQKQKKDNTFSECIKYSKKRYIKLLLNFIYIFLLSHLVFFVTGRIFNVYGTNLVSIVYFMIDMLGLSYFFGTPSYLGTWWYISLISLIIFLFPLIIKLFEKNIIIYLGIIVLFPILLNVDEYFLFRYLPSFSLGMIIAKYDLFAIIKSKLVNKQFLYLICLIFGLIGCYYAIVFRRKAIMIPIGCRDAIITTYICLFSYIYICSLKYVNIVLEYLGIHSMTMFLTHTFIRTTFFKEFSYGFHNAFVNLFVFVIITYVLAWGIDTLKERIGFNKFVKNIANKI